MKKIKLAGWIVVLLLIQSVFLRFIRIGGIGPELLYVFVICYAFFEKEFGYRIGVGIICGILSDIMSSGMPGVCLLIYTISVILEILIFELLYQRHTFMVFLIVFVFTLISNTVFYYINHLGIGYFNAFFAVILPVMLYNLVVSGIFVLIFTRKHKKIIKKRR